MTRLWSSTRRSTGGGTRGSCNQETVSEINRPDREPDSRLGVQKLDIFPGTRFPCEPRLCRLRRNTVPARPVGRENSQRLVNNLQKVIDFFAERGAGEVKPVDPVDHGIL